MKLYSLKEVAEVLGVKYLTAYNYAVDGKIKTVRVGRFIRVSQDELERLTKEGVK